MLTEKQAKLLKIIVRYHQNNGYGPSYEDMRLSMGQKSKSNIHRLVISLRDRGFIEAPSYKRRAIRVIKLPQEFAEEIEIIPRGVDFEQIS